MAIELVEGDSSPIDELALRRCVRDAAPFPHPERFYSRSEIEVLIFSSGIDDEAVLKMLDALDFAPQSA